MAKWSREKVNSENINGGNQYEKKDRVTLEQLNAMVNSGLYSQDFAEHLADAPDISQANTVGSAKVEFVDNVVGGKTYKKFKFSNLKGEKGDTGASAGFGTPTATIDSNVGTPSVTVTASGSDTSKVFNFAFKNLKGEKGDKGNTGATGATPNISVTATTLSAGSSATATISGSAESPTITFGIPKGDKGESGEIYQSTGTSTTGAMSQKATTDELAKKENGHSVLLKFQRNLAHGRKYALAKFLTVKYANITKSIVIKLSMFSDSSQTGSWGAYGFCEDLILSVSPTGDYTNSVCKKYYQTKSDDTSSSGLTVFHGDVGYINDTTNKEVSFYVVVGPYSLTKMTPYEIIPAGYDNQDNIEITQYSGDAQYVELINAFISRGDLIVSKINFKSVSLEYIYPVGSIYMSTNNVSPASFLGGTWTPLDEGYTLWTTKTSGQGGAKISAGLPNITGTTPMLNSLWNYVDATPFNGELTGAMYSYTGVYNGPGPTGSDKCQTRIGFDASKSNSIYGNSTTVQPPAIKVYMWERVS